MLFRRDPSYGVFTTLERERVFERLLLHTPYYPSPVHTLSSDEKEGQVTESQYTSILVNDTHEWTKKQ